MPRPPMPPPAPAPAPVTPPPALAHGASAQSPRAVPLQQEFDRYDTNQDGMLDQDEVIAMMADLGYTRC